MAHRRLIGDPKIAVAYLRVSTAEQRLGPEAQREAIAAFAARAGLEVVAHHSDLGVSGGAELEERPALLAALEDLSARRAGVLLIAKRDRLARDVVVAGLVDREVARRGAAVVAADGAGNGDQPADEFMRGIVDVAARYERALIRARTRAALASKRARGERAGEVPYGHRLAADGVHLEPDPYEQTVIEEVIALRMRGLSLRAVVRELAHAGHRNRAGRRHTLTAVARLAATALSEVSCLAA